MHYSLLCRAIFLQTVAQDAFQSEIQDVSMVREELPDIRILMGHKESLHLQSLIRKIYKAES